jgi:hypothetical protein
LLCFRFYAEYFAEAEAAEAVVWDSCLACSSAVVVGAAEVSEAADSAAVVLGATAEAEADSADLAEAALAAAARAAAGRF